MLRKSLGLFILIAAAATPAFAQNFTSVSGTITDPSAIPYANCNITAELVPSGTNPTIGGAAIGGLNRASCDANGNFSMTLGSNAVILPGGTQWKFTVTETGNPPPLGTGPQSCTATITISGASQSISGNFSCPALGRGSSGTGSAPNLNVQYLARNCGAQVNCTTVKWDAGVSFNADATTTNGSNIVTCPECKFQSGTVGSTTPPAVVGQNFFATDSTSSVAGVNTCQDNPAILFGGVSMTTISSVDSDTQVHVVGNAGTTSTAKACIAWGDDDTTAINAAWTAGGCTTSLFYPIGSTLYSAPIFQKNSGCTYNNAGPFFGQRVEGPNLGGSFLIPVPQAFFNFAPVTGGVAGALDSCLTCTGAVGNPLIFQYTNVQVFGIGQQATGALANTALFLAGTAARVINTNIIGWLGHGGGSTLECIDFLGDEDLFDQGGTAFCGSIGAAVNANLVTFKANFQVGEGGVVGACMVMVGNRQTGANLYTINNSIVGCVQLGNSGGTTNGSLLSQNSLIKGNNKGAADGSCLFVGNNSTAVFIALDQVCLSPVTNENAINFFSTGGTVSASNTKLFANGTGFSVLGAAGNTFNDIIGNSASGGTLWNGLGNFISGSLNPTTFANLATPTNGTERYCSDCTIANPCAGGGTGALAKRLNGVWVCN